MYMMASETKICNTKATKHMIAQPHNFKGKHDTVGNVTKVNLSKEELRQDLFCKDALMSFYLSHSWNERSPPPMQTALAEGSEQLKTKSPYQSTKRHIAYIEDDPVRYRKLKANLDPRYEHIVYSDRENIQKNSSEITSLNGISKFHMFCHDTHDDNITSADFPDAIEVGDDDVHKCRYCEHEYKSSAHFAKHEEECKVVVDSPDSRLVRFTKQFCFCNECNGDINKDCSYQPLKGDLKRQWLLPLPALEKIREKLVANREAKEDEEGLKKSKQIITAIVRKHSGLEAFPLQGADYCNLAARIPSFGNKEMTIKASDIKTVAKTLNLQVTRRDLRTGQPLKSDYEEAFTGAGGWKFVLEGLSAKLLNMT